MALFEQTPACWQTIVLVGNIKKKFSVGVGCGRCPPAICELSSFRISLSCRVVAVLDGVIMYAPTYRDRLVMGCEGVLYSESDATYEGFPTSAWRKPGTDE